MNLADYTRTTVEGLKQRCAQIAQQMQRMQGQFSLIEKLLSNYPRSITQEIDEIPGRRIFYNLNGQIEFTANDANRRGQPVNFLVSQDGAFIMTHYPLVTWKPSAPDNTTLFGCWRSVTHFPMPTQGTTGAADLNDDIISISYELVDGGSQRNFQNLPTPPVLSRIDMLVPLPVPTLFTPNTSIQFFPTYEAISFNSAIAPTAGILSVSLPGYRIVNM